MSAFGAILTILGTAIIFGLAAYGGFHILTHIEHRIAVRKRLHQSLGNRPDGDWPAMPSDFELFHARKDAR